MGFWKNFGSLILGRKDFSSGGWDGSNPEIWSPLNLTNRLGQYGSPAHREEIENDFESYVMGAYKANGPIFACMQARQMVFSEASFQWRRFVQDSPVATGKKMEDMSSAELAEHLRPLFEEDDEEVKARNHGSETTKGRPGDLFGNADLSVLENPWPGGTTGELLQRMIQDADLAGNCYLTLVDDDGNIGRAAKGPTRRVARLRPDWVTILVGTRQEGIEGCYAPDARVLAYVYHPRGSAITGSSGNYAGVDVTLMPDEVCHFSPNPDPTARFRGMSWLTPIIREIQADSLATVHKKKFFEDAAVPNIVVRFDKDVDEDTFDEFVEKFNTEHKGAWNAYKTLFLMGGADVSSITHDFAQMQFTQSQGKSESRIAAAAGVPSSWVGFSEGLTGSGLNSQGVYAAARRRFADGTIRPLWRMAAASLQVLLNVPAGAHLWYDERGIAFLREDAKDLAEIMRINLNAVDAGIKSGFKPDAVVTAVRDNAIERLLSQHTGLVSVQMQMPQTDNTLEEQQKTAAIRQLEATAIVSLAQANFEIGSIAKFLESGDASVLKKDPKAVAAAEAAAKQPPGPGGGKPPASKPPATGKPNTSATGGET